VLHREKDRGLGLALLRLHRRLGEAAPPNSPVEPGAPGLLSEVLDALYDVGSWQGPSDECAICFGPVLISSLHRV
jgi:hypothetical protein